MREGGISAKNIFSRLLTLHELRLVLNKNGTLKKDLELLNIFNKLKINKKNKIICTCGSGVTACILNISLVKIDYLNISVYDGSWSEWGSLKKMPISWKLKNFWMLELYQY